MRRFQLNWAKFVFCFLAASLLISGCILAPENPLETTEPLLTSTNSPTPAGMVIPPTATPLEIVASETPISETETAEPVNTSTPFPVITDTPEPSQTPTDVPQPTQTAYPLVIQAGTPAYIQNFAYPSAGCNWLGVAGQIFDENGTPLLNQVVLVSGQYDGSNVEMIAVTGTGQGDTYGPGGFEIIVSDKLIATDHQLSIQLLDLNGLPLSGTINFDTFKDCQKNLIIINFASRN